MTYSCYISFSVTSFLYKKKTEGIYFVAIAGKFDGKLKLVVWQMDQPTPKLKIRQILSHPYWTTRKKQFDVTQRWILKKDGIFGIVITTGPTRR